MIEQEEEIVYDCPGCGKCNLIESDLGRKTMVSCELCGYRQTKEKNG